MSNQKQQVNNVMAALKNRRNGLQPSIIKETTPVKKLEIETSILEEAKAYSEFVGITSLDETIEKALQYVFEDDSDWQKEKKSLVGKTTKDKSKTKAVSES